MKKVATFTLAVLTAGAAVAQSTNGGWRRMGDPPPASAPVTASAPDQAPLSSSDPSQPVDRSDAYGQAQAAPPMGMQQAPMYGVPQQLVIKAGTYITVRMMTGLNSDRNRPGDVFNGTLVQPVVVDGVVVAQRGQDVYGQVTEAHKAGRVEGVSHLGLGLTGLTLADGTQDQIHSQVVTRNGRTDVGRDVGAVATTTGVGAAIGAAADWGRGAAIGAGAGAAAGLLGVLLTRGQPTVVYPETVLTFQLTQAVAVSTVRAPQAFHYVEPNEYERPTAMVAAQPQPRPGPRPYYGAPYPPPYYYGGPGYYPYYPYYGGYGVGVGVVIRGGSRGRWHRW